MRFKLEDVGRGHYTGVIEVRNLDELPGKIKTTARLMSRDVDIWWNNDMHTEGQIIVGGLRPVGKIFAIDSLTIYL